MRWLLSGLEVVSMSRGSRRAVALCGGQWQQLPELRRRAVHLEAKNRGGLIDVLVYHHRTFIQAGCAIIYILSAPIVH